MIRQLLPEPYDILNQHFSLAVSRVCLARIDELKAACLLCDFAKPFLVFKKKSGALVGRRPPCESESELVMVKLCPGLFHDEVQQFVF